MEQNVAYIIYRNLVLQLLSRFEDRVSQLCAICWSAQDTGARRDEQSWKVAKHFAQKYAVGPRIAGST